MPVHKVCLNCAKEFTTPNRRSEAVKYCSIPCSSAHRRVTLICKNCGCEFQRVRSDHRKVYCSNECSYAARKGKPLVRKNPSRHFGKCEVCSKEFRITATRKETARFCSRVCQSNSPERRAEMSAVQTGEKSHRWKGGRYKRGDGYVRARGIGIEFKQGRTEHRFVMERAMLEHAPDHPLLIEINGVKRLNKDIEVHHRDRNRSNNEFSNLLAVTKNAHAQIHHRNKRPQPWECWPYSHSENCQETSQMQNATKYVEGGGQWKTP